MVGQWGMSHGEDGSESAGAMTFLGNWRQVWGVVGGAVEFTSPPGSGVARGTGDMNPGTEDFAMSVVFTSGEIPLGIDYSGNLMQKGAMTAAGR